MDTKNYRLFTRGDHQFAHAIDNNGTEGTREYRVLYLDGAERLKDGIHDRKLFNDLVAAHMQYGDRKRNDSNPEHTISYNG